ncbi:MAG: zinc-dependent metalloprotease [Candidatus Cloacimonetes bacterium]|nr:zinc-dependent metalloprotease [Candidatus Cloacimonadota bacterium]
MMKKIIILFIILTLVIIVYAEEAITQSTTQETISDSTAKEKPKDLKSFSETIKNFSLIPGFYDFYINNEKNQVYMKIKPEQIGELFLLTLSRIKGDGAFFGSGDMLEDFPLYFERAKNKIFLKKKNTNYRADSNSAINSALEQHIPDSILLSAEIISLPEEQTGSILIDPSGYFIRDNANVSTYIGYWVKNASLNVDSNSSYISKIKSFPENTELDVAINFTTSANLWSASIPDSRSILHTYRYSLSKIPQNNYIPRMSDDRVGYFITLFKDYSSLDKEDDYVRYINRWHLEKEKPEANMSRPIKPILFWLHKNIPEEYRKGVRDGILEWNKAFERIGYKDAILVKQMPDDADWDIEDIRYNVVQWVIEPDAGYAMGPSRANPFTGEIYEATVKVSADMLRYNYDNVEYLVEPMTMRIPEHKLPFNEMNPFNFDRLFNYHQNLSNDRMFAFNVLQMRSLPGNGNFDKDKFIYEYLKSLLVHEIGHTLGLRHNFKASYAVNYDDLQNPKITQKTGLTASVMDYAPINLAAPGQKQGQYFQTNLGEYDFWAIEYGYKDLGKKTPEEEKAQLQEIASQSEKRSELAYATDEDVQGNSLSIDPQTNFWDLGDDALKFAQNRLDISKELISKLDKLYNIKGEQYHKFRAGFSYALSQYWTSISVTSKYVGGIYHSRDRVGGTIPYRIVEANKQKLAIDFLCQNIFAEDAFEFSADLLNKLTYNKNYSFSWSPWNIRQDYPLHKTVSNFQNYTLGLLYNENKLERILDNEMKFTNEEQTFTLAEMFTTLRNEIWKEIIDRTNINSFRRNLQNMHLETLITIYENKNNRYPRDAANLAHLDLVKISQLIDGVENIEQSDDYFQAHLLSINSTIRKILDDDKNKK